MRRLNAQRINGFHVMTYISSGYIEDIYKKVCLEEYPDAVEADEDGGGGDEEYVKRM